MRIALAGTFGVGKTELALSLSKNLGLTLLPEVPRTVIRNSYESMEKFLKADMLSKEGIQRRIMDAQVNLEAGYSRQGFVSEISVFDILSYAEMYRIYIQPSEFDVEEDELKFLPDTFRYDVNMHLEKYVHAYEIINGTVWDLKVSSLEERLKEVLKVIKRRETCRSL